MTSTPPPTPEEPTPRSGPPGSGSTSGESDRAASGSPAAVTPPVPLTQQLGRITIVVLAVLFGVFAVANSQRVDFSWVFGETIVEQATGGGVTGGVPLILLLVVAFVLGAVITALLELYVSRGRRARRARRDRGPDADRA